jgi:hypothetical protein
MSHYEMGDGESVEFTEDDCSVEFEQGIDPVLETAKAVDNAIKSARETIARLTIENAIQAREIDRLTRENARHRRNGLLRLMADLRKPETLEDIARERMERSQVERILDGAAS